MSIFYRALRLSVDNDKTIGRLPIINTLVHMYTTSSDKDKHTQTYLSNALQSKSNPQFNYDIHDAVIDTISSQTDDIKYIKLELITVNSKLKRLLDNSTKSSCSDCTKCVK